MEEESFLPLGRGCQLLAFSIRRAAYPAARADDQLLNGRLYAWESAQQACAAIGDGWRLPTNEEWRQLGNRYRGIRPESADLGKAS